MAWRVSVFFSGGILLVSGHLPTLRWVFTTLR